MPGIPRTTAGIPAVPNQDLMNELQKKIAPPSQNASQQEEESQANPSGSKNLTGSHFDKGAALYLGKKAPVPPPKPVNPASVTTDAECIPVLPTRKTVTTPKGPAFTLIAEVYNPSREPHIVADTSSAYRMNPNYDSPKNLASQGTDTEHLYDGSPLASASTPVSVLAEDTYDDCSETKRSSIPVSVLAEEATVAEEPFYDTVNYYTVDQLFPNKLEEKKQRQQAWDSTKAKIQNSYVEVFTKGNSFSKSFEKDVQDVTKQIQLGQGAKTQAKHSIKSGSMRRAKEDAELPFHLKPFENKIKEFSVSFIFTKTTFEAQHMKSKDPVELGAFSQCISLQAGLLRQKVTETREGALKALTEASKSRETNGLDPDPYLLPAQRAFSLCEMATEILDYNVKEAMKSQGEDISTKKIFSQMEAEIKSFNKGPQRFFSRWNQELSGNTVPDPSKRPLVKSTSAPQPDENYIYVTNTPPARNSAPVSGSDEGERRGADHPPLSDTSVDADGYQIARPAPGLLSISGSQEGAKRVADRPPLPTPSVDEDGYQIAQPTPGLLPVSGLQEGEGGEPIYDNADNIVHNMFALSAKRNSDSDKADYLHPTL